ncbi:hypothetical protein BGZ52_000588, partial [Haplosporangium bisporale]
RRHKAQITFSGDKIPNHESALVFGNHRSFTDFYMFHSVAARRGMVNYMKVSNLVEGMSTELLAYT